MRTTSKLQNTRTMTMKMSMKMIMMFFAGIFTAALSALGQVNSLAVGTVFTERGISGYGFNANHYVEQIGEYLEMEGTIDLQGWVTSLRTGGIDILDPGEKLAGIPIPLIGYMKNLNLSVYALDKNQRIIARGWANYDMLAAGQQIEVVLRLEQNAKHVKFVRSGVDGDVVYVDGNQIGYFYDGGYVIWPNLSTSFGTHEYQIFDIDGNPVEIGELDINYDRIQEPASQKYAGMSIGIEGGVEYLTSDEVNPNTSYTIDGQIATEDGGIDSAKVFVIEPGSSGGIIWIGGNYISASVCIVDGDTVYELTELVPQDQYGWMWYSFSASDQNLLVVVRGEPGDGINFSAGFNGKGGGKGKPARR